MRLAFLTTFSLACFVMVPSLPAKLVWESTVIEKRAALGQEEVPLEFAFRNEGTTPITIQRIEVSCGCTATSLAEPTLAPGARSTLEVLYRPDGQTGRQSKTVTVHTSDAPDRPVSLTFNVDVPAWFEIAPRQVTWERGGPPQDRVIDITLHHIPGTTVTVLNPDQERLVVRLEEGAGPGKQRLRLTPKSTAEAFRAIVRLKVETAGLEARILAVYADLR
jgi:hypothetical protein